MKNSTQKKYSNLVDALNLLEGSKEMDGFLQDLLTKQELLEFGNRWKAAQMLNNNVPYSIIEKETGLSSTTVARVSKWLNTGKGGYAIALKRLSIQHHSHPKLSAKKG